MIAEFKIRNFYSLRDEQTLSFIPTNDDTSRDIYTEEVADGVSLLSRSCWMTCLGRNGHSLK